MINKISDKLKNIINKDNLSLFILLFFLFFLVTSAFTYANVLYIDDVAHTLYGYKDWHLLDRYTISFLSFIFSTGNYTTDISPLSNIISAFIMSISGIILIHLFNFKNKNIILKVMAVAPIGISPFLLQNLSYKVDMPYMMLSILFSIIPFALYKYKLAFYISSFICILLMLMTYQATSGIYLIILLFIVFDNWLFKKINTKELLITLLIPMGIYILSNLTFKFFIMDVSSEYLDISTFKFNELFFGVIQNIINYFRNFWDLQNISWKVLLIIIIIYLIYSVVSSSKQNKVLSFILCILFLLVTFILSFGIYIILKNPTYDVRTLMSLSVFNAIINLYLIKLSKAIIPKICISLLDLFFIIFVFQYTNVLKTNDLYDEYILTSINKNLSQLDCVKNDGSIDLLVTGNTIFSPAIINEKLNDYKILYKLIPISLNDETIWHGFEKMKYFGLIEINQNKTDEASKLNLITYKDTFNYTIEVSNNCLNSSIIKEKNGINENYKKYIHIILK